MNEAIIEVSNSQLVILFAMCMECSNKLNCLHGCITACLNTFTAAVSNTRILYLVALSLFLLEGEDVAAVVTLERHSSFSNVQLLYSKDLVIECTSALYNCYLCEDTGT